jgi:hypothetical protein
MKLSESLTNSVCVQPGVPLDASRVCCHSADIDACGACDGTNSTCEAHVYVNIRLDTQNNDTVGEAEVIAAFEELLGSTFGPTYPVDNLNYSGLYIYSYGSYSSGYAAQVCSAPCCLHLHAQDMSMRALLFCRVQGMYSHPSCDTLHVKMQMYDIKFNVDFGHITLDTKQRVHISVPSRYCRAILSCLSLDALPSAVITSDEGMQFSVRVRPWPGEASQTVLNTGFAWQALFNEANDTETSTSLGIVKNETYIYAYPVCGDGVCSPGELQVYDNRLSWSCYEDCISATSCSADNSPPLLYHAIGSHVSSYDSSKLTMAQLASIHRVRICMHACIASWPVGHATDDSKSAAPLSSIYLVNLCSHAVPCLLF